MDRIVTHAATVAASSVLACHLIHIVINIVKCGNRLAIFATKRGNYIVKVTKACFDLELPDPYLRLPRACHRHGQSRVALPPRAAALKQRESALKQRESALKQRESALKQR